MQITQAYLSNAPAIVPLNLLKIGDISPQDKKRIVARLSGDFMVEEERAERLFEATIVFLSMCVQYAGNHFVPSEEVDKKGWHTFLLYNPCLPKVLACTRCGLYPP